MNIAEIRAELENDQGWRRDEIRSLQNQGSSIEDLEQQGQFRRALVVLLYAHFEGFCKFALTVYVNAVNKTGIRCAEANYALAAASLADLFAALRDSTSKCPEFRFTLPDDTHLHRFARDREFVERVADFENRKLEIPEDVIDTESNLKPVVLRKNLFRVGLTHDQFAFLDGDIHRLLNSRNKIAHGEARSGIKSTEYEALRAAVFYIMDSVTAGVMQALLEERFLRSPKKATVS
jgi:hypothetical protein